MMDLNKDAGLIQVDFEIQNGEIVKQSLENLTGEYIKVGRREMAKVMRRMWGRIVRQPRKKPPDWEPMSREQWNYVQMAIHRKLMNVPYRRSGAYRRSWKIVQIDNGYALTGGGYWIPGTGMRVGEPASTYIGGNLEGEKQSFLHQGRWAVARHVIDEEVATLHPAIQREMNVVTRRLGF